MKIKFLIIGLALILAVVFVRAFSTTPSDDLIVGDDSFTDSVPMSPQSTIDQFHATFEGQNLVFTERQDSWGITWSYITTDSQPPTPQFLGIPPGVNNLGVPKNASMPKVFGYLMTSNYSSNGTNLGCILNCNITSTFNWTPGYCDSIPKNYTFYNTTMNESGGYTLTKYNYHWNLLKWRSDLPFPGVPIDTIIEKVLVKDVARPALIEGLPISDSAVVGVNKIYNYIAYALDERLCGSADDSISSIYSNFGTIIHLSGESYSWNWIPAPSDVGLKNLTINVTTAKNLTTNYTVRITVASSLSDSNIAPVIYATPAEKVASFEPIVASSQPALSLNTERPYIDPATAYKSMNPQSTIDQFHRAWEGQRITFSERQDSWGITWSYITTDSQPPTPQFLGIPPGIDNLGMPRGATMPTVFGYLKTDNYTSNGTNLGCILNCNITSTFDWTPDFCQSIPMNYTFYNTTSNNTTKYNYHWNLLKWRSDLPFPGVPIDTIIEKVRVDNVNRPPSIDAGSKIPAYKFAPVGSRWLLEVFGYDADFTECKDDNLTMNYSSSLGARPGTFTDYANGTAYLDWTPSISELGGQKLTFVAKDGNTTNASKESIVLVYSPKGTANYVINEGDFLTFSRSQNVAAGEAVKIEPQQANLPAGSLFSIASGTDNTSTMFIWNTTNCSGKSTPYSFQVKYYASNQLFDVETINIAVANFNNIPTMTKIPAYAAETYNYMTQPTGYTPIDWQFSVDDLDLACGDDPLGAVNMTVTPFKPSGATLSRIGASNTYNFHYLPTLSDKGRLTFTFSVSDSLGGSVQKQFIIDVFGQTPFQKNLPVKVASDSSDGMN